MISARVLGPVDVSIDGNPAPAELLWRKHLGLLIYLARSPKLARTREHLVGVFWADKSESAARHSLSEALRVLRKSLGEEELDTGAGQIHLTAGAVELDVDLFESRVAAGDLGSACELITGEFLEGLSIVDAIGFEDWVTAERRHWRERSITVLIAHAEELLRRGGTGDAVDLARRAVALDRSSEPAAGTLMRCLALAGDRGAALEAFADYRGALREAVGAEPSGPIRDLAERIRAERVYKVAAPAIEGPAPETRRAPLVGRRDDLSGLLAEWQRTVAEHRAALVLVAGDLGIGKSRLIEELLARARLDSATVATVRAVDGDRSIPWHGALGLARGGLLNAPGLPAAPPAALAAFGSRIPEWADRFGAAPDPADQLGSPFSEVIAAVAHERPVVLAVDDAHWLDRESLLALVGTVRDQAQRPLLLVMAVAREHGGAELDSVRVQLGGEIPGRLIQPDPLTTTEVMELCRWALPSYSAVELDRVSRRVRADSAGLPFLVVELVHAIASGLDLGAHRGAWPAPFRTLEHSLPGDLPDTVVSAIRVGFRRLGKPAQQALIVAALGPERATLADLRRGADFDAAELDQALDELEWQRWLESDARGYSFIAGIARRVIARDMVTPGQQRRVRDRIAGRS